MGGFALLGLPWAWFYFKIFFFQILVQFFLGFFFFFCLKVEQIIFFFFKCEGVPNLA